MISKLSISATIGLTALAPLIYSQKGGLPRPNIVYIMSDDHAWQAISAYRRLTDLMEKYKDSDALAKSYLP